MTLAGQAVPTAVTRDMTFDANQLIELETRDVAAKSGHYP